jgi:hypothetical protein
VSTTGIESAADRHIVNLSWSELIERESSLEESFFKDHFGAEGMRSGSGDQSFHGSVLAAPACMTRSFILVP